MALSERVANEHRQLVVCLDAITEHSGRTILEMGVRLGDVMQQGLRLRSLMQEVAAMVGTLHAETLAGDLDGHAVRFRDLADRGSPGELGAACETLAQTLRVEVKRLVQSDRRRKTEVLTLTSELGALTGTLLARTGQAISALQFQDPAVQELRRIDSLVLDLRRAIDDTAEAVKWRHRVGDARLDQRKTPAALASRALAIRNDTRLRTEAFAARTQQAVRKVKRIQAHLRSVTHAQVAKSRQAAETLDPKATAADALERYGATFDAALSELGAMLETGEQLTGNLSRILALSAHALDEGDGRRSTIARASDQVLRAAATDDRGDLQPLYEALRASQETVVQLVEHDHGVRTLARRVEEQLTATRTTFAAFERPIRSGDADPVPERLAQAGEVADRLFSIVCEELGLDPSTIEPEADLDRAMSDHRNADDGLILL
ncbi:MAG: hypothetical protein AAF211_02185 [Myxococcota bacterium]